MKRLLWWCICLWAVGSQALVAGGRWSVVGTTALSENLSGSAVRHTRTQAVSLTGHRPPTTDHLPCTDASSACLQTLSNLAIANSREIAVLQQAIQVQKKKLWTNWLNADGLHPLAMGLRIVRNAVGGEDRAALKLEIARLELRRTELETNLCQAVSQAVLDLEAAQAEQVQLHMNLVMVVLCVQWAETAYRWGEGSTEAMLTLWRAEVEAQAQFRRAEQQASNAHRRLWRIVFPLALSR